MTNATDSACSRNPSAATDTSMTRPLWPRMKRCTAPFGSWISAITFDASMLVPKVSFAKFTNRVT